MGRASLSVAWLGSVLLLAIAGSSAQGLEPAGIGTPPRVALWPWLFLAALPAAAPGRRAVAPALFLGALAPLLVLIARLEAALPGEADASPQLELFALVGLLVLLHAARSGARSKSPSPAGAQVSGSLHLQRIAVLAGIFLPAALLGVEALALGRTTAWLSGAGEANPLVWAWRSARGEGPDPWMALGACALLALVVNLWARGALAEAPPDAGPEPDPR